MSIRSRSKENSNQTRRERSSTSVNQPTEAENNKTLEPKVQQLEREFSLLKQKTNQGEIQNISFKRHLSPAPSLSSSKKQNNFNTHQETKKRTRGLCQQQRPKDFKNTNSKNSSPDNGNIKPLRKTIERTNRYRVDPFENVTNLSKF